MIDECAMSGEVKDKPETTRTNKKQLERLDCICSKCGYRDGEHGYGHYKNGKNVLLCPPEYDTYIKEA